MGVIAYGITVLILLAIQLIMTVFVFYYGIQILRKGWITMAAFCIIAMAISNMVTTAALVMVKTYYSEME